MLRVAYSRALVPMLAAEWTCICLCRLALPEFAARFMGSVPVHSATAQPSMEGFHEGRSPV